MRFKLFSLINHFTNANYIFVPIITKNAPYSNKQLMMAHIKAMAMFTLRQDTKAMHDFLFDPIQKCVVDSSSVHAKQSPREIKFPK